MRSFTRLQRRLILRIYTTPHDYFKYYCLGNGKFGNVGGNWSPATVNTPQYLQ